MCVSCAQCADLISLDVARSYGKYGGELGALLRHYKYRGDRSLAYGVARLMGQTLANDWHCSEWDAVVAVPMHPARIRERGFDHMELVGRLLAKQVGLPFSKVLSKRLASRPQAGLAEKQRRRNVRRTFALRGPVSARRILLLDDIFTTGATANECARILKKAGVLRVGVLTAARAE
jgi:ComF family protein